MLNKAQLIGNLGADPKTSPTKDGRGKVTSFSVATTEKGYTLKDGTQVPDRTEWHNVVTFGRMAEVAALYLKKGSKVYIEGKLRTKGYEDSKGAKRYITEIHADMMEMLDSRPKQEQVQPMQQPLQQPASPTGSGTSGQTGIPWEDAPGSYTDSDYNETGLPF